MFYRLILKGDIDADIKCIDLPWVVVEKRVGLRKGVRLLAPVPVLELAL